ncbi:hypothetical protein DY000_02009968 [Brassica cretica]|uniref:Uncharacterized protein n=1 Tax=Brassica cretica TaxID=69181 RepID=A0ABQ7CB28_BRACR|nr:hypothetical protein DY000_02009968 [Brassica cretica]
MISPRWDPGNGGGERVDLQEQQGTECGFLDWAMLLNLRGFDLDIRNGYFGKLRRTRVSEISITISIIIKTKSQRSTDSMEKIGNEISQRISVGDIWN